MNNFFYGNHFLTAIRSSNNGFSSSIQRYSEFYFSFRGILKNKHIYTRFFIKKTTFKKTFKKKNPKFFVLFANSLTLLVPMQQLIVLFVQHVHWNESMAYKLHQAIFPAIKNTLKTRKQTKNTKKSKKKKINQNKPQPPIYLQNPPPLLNLQNLDDFHLFYATTTNTTSLVATLVGLSKNREISSAPDTTTRDNDSIVRVATQCRLINYDRRPYVASLQEIEQIFDSIVPVFRSLKKIQFLNSILQKQKKKKQNKIIIIIIWIVFEF